jgi:hypothetical protein
VTQIADGENGGVMMNEFPAKYFEVIRECSGSLTPVMNVTVYLERLQSVGVHANDLQVIQPLFQARIWERTVPGDGPERMAEVIKQLRAQDGRFSMEGGSWTNNRSWVQGYDTVPVPMERASSLFHEWITASGIRRDDPRYRNALFLCWLLLTSAQKIGMLRTIEQCAGYIGCPFAKFVVFCERTSYVASTRAGPRKHPVRDATPACRKRLGGRSGA